MSQTLSPPLPADPRPAAGLDDETPRQARPLPDRLSARTLLSRGQSLSLAVFVTAVLGMLGLRITTGLGASLLAWAVGAVAAATVVYVALIAFRLVLVMAAQEAPVMRFTQEELRAVPDSDLPGYSLLVPLHREERVLPAPIAKLSSIDYPADRLQVLLLIEEDDGPTRAALDRIVLDSRFEVVLVPPSQPRTKPKACNVGLSHARGEFCVIYDAEDRHEPEKLRKAVLAFRRLSQRGG